MTKYIEWAALFDLLNKRLNNPRIVGWLSRLASEVPAADVVEVVRCKECQHYMMPGYCIRTTAANKFPRMKLDDFCSYGERRDDQ